MTNYLTYAFFLLLAIGVADCAFADENLREFYGRGIDSTVTPEKAQRNNEQAGRPLAPDTVQKRREIVIDKGGRRIGFAISDSKGDTNNELLRLRSGRRVGNQIFDSGGRRVGTIISR